MADYDPDKHCGGQRLNQPPGTLCTRPKGWGTDHPGWGRCKRHGGSTSSHTKRANLQIVQAECERLSIPVETNPDDALLDELYRTKGWVNTYEAAVNELELHPEADRYIPGDEDGDGHWERGDGGVYGRMYHLTGMPTGEAKPHVLVELLFRERKHFADVAVAALRANIDERRVKIAEDQADMVHRAFEAALEAMNATPEQRQDGRRAYVGHLRAA